jgi:signal peptidase I
MEPTLFPGDIIMVSKMSYGTRVIKFGEFLKKKESKYFRTKGWTSIKKGDVFVFNWPNYEKFNENGYGIYGDYVIKRCFGLPGDCITIRNKEEDKTRRLYTKYQDRYTLFPNDSALKWTLDNYGPLYIPAKGDQIILSKKNVMWYKDILQYENPSYHIKDSCLINREAKNILSYIFKHNYYFMLGDNFYNSEDSRYWGLVPEDNIIGKAVVVLFSLDLQKDGFKKIRMNRIIKGLNQQSSK